VPEEKNLNHELLKLAAKGCRLEIEPCTCRDPKWPFRLKGQSGVRAHWNPLTNDGDALKLAVELRLNIEINAGGVDVYSGDLDEGLYVPVCGNLQLWLASREITQGTHNNYKSALNLYWMPRLALVRIDLITTTLLRRVITETEWTSANVKRNAITRLSTILAAATREGLLTKNPAEVIELPKRSRKEIAPFTLAEANTIIDKLYEHKYWPSLIYAALFEFMFFTGLRLSEALAVRWDVIDMEKRTVHVKRTVALGAVEERTKTGRDRFVLLNDRALRAIQFARGYADRRRHGKGAVTETPFLFPPSKNAEHVKQTSDLHKQWVPVLNELGIRRRPPYNCRHTYATICLMSGLNPAFIAQQLGHSVQMLLSTYARWLNSSSDWSELEKLKIGIKSVSA